VFWCAPFLTAIVWAVVCGYIDHKSFQKWKKKNPNAEPKRFKYLEDKEFREEKIVSFEKRIFVTLILLIPIPFVDCF
jgi:hypothetical protein